MTTTPIHPIEIQMLTGPAAGRRFVLEQSPITFGRSPDNTLVIDLPYVSRRHGELRAQDGRWVLVNHSPAGTRLNRKRVTDTPRVLDPQAEVAIGDEPVFLAAYAPAPAPAASPAEKASPARHPRLSRRTKLWAGIGAYMVVMLGLIVFLSTLDRRGQAASGALAPELTVQQIEAEIRRDVPAQPADARRARAALREATELFAMRDAVPDARYRAYEAYRVALAYSPGQRLEDGIDLRRYLLVQDELVEEVTRQYQTGYNLLRSGRYDAAYAAFEKLVEQVYPAGRNSRIFQNAEAHRLAARQGMSRRR